MAGVAILINFDNDWYSFYPGQVIKGKVTLSNHVEMKVKGLTVTFFGEAEVYWTESEVQQDTMSPHHGHHNHQRHDQSRPRRRHVHREYRNHETLLCRELVLFGQAEEEGGSEYVIPPGVQQHTFSLQLPSDSLPSTFSESAYGFVRYSAEARLKRSMFRYDKAEQEFFISGILDLNFMPPVLQPFGVNGQMDFGWLCCPDGVATADLKLPKTGYIPGERIPFTVSVMNWSTVQITQIYAKFIRDIQFVTFDRTRSTSTDMQMAAYGTTVPRGGVAEWNETFNVSPGMPPTNLAGCRIIKVTYRILVRVQGGGEMLNLTAPITIGTEAESSFADSAAAHSLLASVEKQPRAMEPIQVEPMSNVTLPSTSKAAFMDRSYNPNLNPFENTQEEQSSDFEGDKKPEEVDITQIKEAVINSEDKNNGDHENQE